MADPQFISCPHCTIQIPGDAPECPHCQQPLPPPGRQAPAFAEVMSKEGRRLFRLPERYDVVLSPLWNRYGRWIVAAGTVLLGLALLFIGYGTRGGYKVRIVPNPSLPVTVSQQKGEKTVLLKVTVTNRGEDIPDLSLKSVAVVVEFLHGSGRRDKKTAFPKAEYRGEGALLHGESGIFEMETGTEGLTEIVLRSEVIDLGLGRKLIPPGSRR